MTTRPYATTNARLEECLSILHELIDWADADADHSAENDAPATAKDDRWRAKTLRQARALIEACAR